MRLRTVGVKLSLALIAVVAGALATVYFAVVPTIEDRLVNGRISQLEQTANAIITDYLRESLEENFLLDDFIDTESQVRGVRATVYSYLQATDPVILSPIADSRRTGLTDEQDPVAVRAAARRRTEKGIINRGDTRIGEVAIPFEDAFVLRVAAPIDDAYETVELVRERLIAAGLLALLAAALTGFLLARVFARRIQRLERAANRIAGGQFDQVVEDPSEDELGQLARAFDRMRERLSALERARREFIANASHELRTPIFALGGHVELLTEDDMDEATRREFLAEMRLQVERLTKLATDLLDLSRLDAGRLHVELAPVDLAEVAASLAAEFSGVGRGSEHVLEVDADSGATALADEERVRQIGRILVENSLLHTPPGTVVLLRTAKTGAGVELRVEDDGPGVPAGDQQHVFERFYRGDGTLASGSGLGLAIAQELAGVMGGSIELSSRAGRTVFTLKLPASSAEVDEREPALAR